MINYHMKHQTIAQSVKVKKDHYVVNHWLNKKLVKTQKLDKRVDLNNSLVDLKKTFTYQVAQVIEIANFRETKELINNSLTLWEKKIFKNLKEGKK